MYYKKIFASREEAMQEQKAKGFKHIHIINGDYCYKALTVNDEHYTGMVAHNPDESDVVSLVKECADCCKILRYIPNPEWELGVAPIEHNYITGLITRLFAKRTFVQGELQRIDWYADEMETDLVIRVEVVYERDAVGFATRRTTTRTWIKEDGTDASPQKITIKNYTSDMLGQIDEGVRRRGNLVKGIQMPVMGMLLATISAKDGESEIERQSRIILLGRKFLSDNKKYFTAFTEDSNREIVNVIEGSTDFWMDNVIDGNGTTIRQYLVNELNIGGIG